MEGDDVASCRSLDSDKGVIGELFLVGDNSSSVTL